MSLLIVSKLNTKVYNPIDIKDTYTEQYLRAEITEEKRRITEPIIRSFNLPTADSWY